MFDGFEKKHDSSQLNEFSFVLENFEVSGIKSLHQIMIAQQMLKVDCYMMSFSMHILLILTCKHYERHISYSRELFKLAAWWSLEEAYMRLFQTSWEIISYYFHK